MLLFFQTVLWSDSKRYLDTYLSSTSYPMKIIKRCGHCGGEFESEKHWNKLYCSHPCYQRAKVSRRVAKDKQTTLTDPIVDARFVTILNYPSAERLHREAQLLSDGEYVKVVGMTHMWERPTNIAFVKQPDQENNTDVWVMTKREPSPFDAILNRQ